MTTSLRPTSRLESGLLMAGLTLIAVCALWSVAGTLRAWEARAALAVPGDAHERALTGVLEIPRLHVTAAVADGDDAMTLALAAGHLRDSSVPWMGGNTAIAGHRDQVFRALRQIRRGDRIQLRTAHGTFSYAVRTTRVVAPTDVTVLAPTRHAQLTLITCYPFTFFGQAPERFIVIADRAAPDA